MLAEFLVGAAPGGYLPDDLATFMLGATSFGVVIARTTIKPGSPVFFKTGVRSSRDFYNLWERIAPLLTFIFGFLKATISPEELSLYIRLVPC